MNSDQPNDTYRRLRSDGKTMTTAAVLAGLSLGEARAIEAADLASATSPFIPAAGTPQTAKDEPMSRASAKKAAEQAKEIKQPDYDLAVKIYREDIKKASSNRATHDQELSQAYKDIKKRANIQPQAAKLAFKLDAMEEHKRDDFLRSLNGLLKRLNIFMPTDLVDAAEGKGDANEDVIPIGQRQRPQLATVPVSDGIDADLNPDDDDGDDGDDLDIDVDEREDADLPLAAE